MAMETVRTQDHGGQGCASSTAAAAEEVEIVERALDAGEPHANLGAFGLVLDRRYHTSFLSGPEARRCAASRPQRDPDVSRQLSALPARSARGSSPSAGRTRRRSAGSARASPPRSPRGRGGGPSDRSAATARTHAPTSRKEPRVTNRRWCVLTYTTARNGQARGGAAAPREGSFSGRPLSRRRAH